MKYFWIFLGGVCSAAAIVAGFTFATLEVLSHVWNPVDNVRAEDFAGRWIGVSPDENDVEISIDRNGRRAEISQWPASLDCKVGRVDGPSRLDGIQWTPNSSFLVEVYPPDRAPVLNLGSFENETCSRSFRFTVERNARSGELRISYHVGNLDDDTLDQALVFMRMDSYLPSP